MAEFYGSDMIKFVTANTKEVPEVGMNLMVTAIPALFVYKNGKLVESFTGANKPRLEKLIIQLKKDLSDDGKMAASKGAVQEAPIMRLKPDLGFTQFKPRTYYEILFENTGMIGKIGKKVKEVISTIEGEDLTQLKDLLDDFKMSLIDETILHQLLVSIDKCNEDDIFALFDYLR